MISVVLATHNEAKNLAKCLQSVQDFASEIIIVDGESTDDTIAIAKKFKAKVVKTTNKPIFHINKQMAMDLAQHKLVLQLDADEVVDRKLHDFIIKLDSELNRLDAVALKQFQPKAWNLKRKNFFLGRWLSKGGQYPDPVIRLFINGYAHLPQVSVHEQMEVKGEVATAPGHLLHYSNPSFSSYLEKFNRYTDLSAAELVGKNQASNLTTFMRFCIFEPSATFLLLYFRHKGLLDGMAGFIFALMSAMHFPVTYLKYRELKNHGT